MDSPPDDWHSDANAKGILVQGSAARVRDKAAQVNVLLFQLDAVLLSGNHRIKSVHGIGALK